MHSELLVLIKYLTLLEAAFRSDPTCAAAAVRLKNRRLELFGTKRCCCQHVFVCLIMSSIRGVRTIGDVAHCIVVVCHWLTMLLLPPNEQASTTTAAAAVVVQDVMIHV